MISRNEIIDLLTLATVYDQRNADEADVRGWLAVAQIENWTAETAQRAVIEHYSRGADRPRITPAAITDTIRTARRKAASTFDAPDVPEEITGRDYPEWYRCRLAEHVDRVMSAWAAGDPIPESSPVVEDTRSRRQVTAGVDTFGCPDDLREQFERDLARAGRPEQIRRISRDPDRRAAAQAELDEARRRGSEGGDAA